MKPNYDQSRPRCPSCGSDRVTHYRHPKTNERVEADGVYLARCVKCENVFGISEFEERYIPAEVEVGARIDEELRCPRCDYNLRSLHFGAICPECGARIPPSKTAIDDVKHGPECDVPGWLGLLLLITAFGGAIFTRATRNFYGLILAMMTGGLYLILLGRQGLHRRRISAPSSRGGSEVRGGFAVFWSCFYLGVGGLLLAAGVVWLGIIVLQRLGIL